MHDLLTRHPQLPRWRAAAAVVAAAALCACTTTTPGTPTESELATETPATTTAAPVDPAALDPGHYPTTAASPAGPAGTDAEGRLVEGRRMAGAVVGPWEVDPTLTRSGGAPAALITNASELGAVIYPTTTYKTPNLSSMLVAFSSERWAADPHSLTRLRNTLLRFPNDATAASVATGLTEGTLTMLVRTDSGDPIPVEPIRAVPVPRTPNTPAAILTFREGTQTVHEAILITAHGPFVLVHSARTADDPNAALTLVADTLERQRTQLDTFAATPANQLSTLPKDPTGLAARTVPASDPTTLQSGTYDPHGALHLQADPTTAQAAFADAGVDVVSAALTTVYQSTDPAAAQTLAAQLHDASGDEAEAVPGLPDSHCARTTSGAGSLVRYQCIAATDRYAFTTISRDLTTAHQQSAAQYLMLTSP